MSIIDILLLVLIISATALCIYLIISLRKISRNVDLMQTDIHRFLEAATPAVEKLESIAEKLDNITSTTERHVIEVSDSIDGYVERSKQYLATLKSESTQNQVVSLINNLRAIVRGFSVFLRDLKA
jgi:hypothetical protein